MPMNRTRARHGLALGVAAVSAFIALVGCASHATEAAGTDGAELRSNSKTFVVPVDDRARELCRDETTQEYCTDGEAQTAAASCLAKIGAGGRDVCAEDGTGAGCIRFETVTAPCRRSGPVYPDAASCATPRPENCAFYTACLEPSHPCGDEGYALGFGDKFCYHFKNTEFSARGNVWRDTVMTCLQEQLVPKVSDPDPLVCSDLTDFAFGSHPACYTGEGASICFLPPSDLLRVFGVIGIGEALQARTASQIRSVIGTCLGQFGGLFGGRARALPEGATPFEAHRTIVGVTPADLEASYGFWAAKADEYGVAR